MVAVPFWFGSCSKSGSDPVNPSSSVEGTWAFTGLKIDPAYDLLGTGTKTNDLLAILSVFGGPDAATCFTTSKIIFQSGGKLSGVTGSKCTTNNTSQLPDNNGSWKLDGTKLTLTDSSGASEVYDTALSGNSLKLSQTSSDTDLDGDGKKDTVTTIIEMIRA
jgi:hypothetical protein